MYGLTMKCKVFNKIKGVCPYGLGLSSCGHVKGRPELGRKERNNQKLAMSFH
jgi:hypothetical protein